jgi:hypothetical protein
MTRDSTTKDTDAGTVIINSQARRRVTPRPEIICEFPPCTPVPPPSNPTPPSVDCKTNPSDPTCTSNPSPVDCTKKPEDPSCKSSPQTPVDCKAHPDDPSCKVDCSKTPNDPSCKVDCSKTPNDPSCKVDCSKTPNDPSCKVDCSKTPNDTKCIKCPDGSKPVDGKCVCPTGSSLVNGKCEPVVCPKGFKQEHGICERTIIRNIIIRESHQQQQPPKPNSLISLDSEQICKELGDQACISSLHNFKLLFIHTSKDSLGYWGVTGEVQNIASKSISQLQVIVHFYDSDGNIVGLTQAFTTPSKLMSMQTAIFNIKQNSSELTGTPKYYRISYDFLG